MASMKIEDFLKKVNLSLQDMTINKVYDVSDFNLKVKSFNEKENKNEFKRILSVIKKDDDTEYDVILSRNNKSILKCSGNHKIFSLTTKDYVPVSSFDKGKILTEDGKEAEVYIKHTDNVINLLDLEVEDNHNYFTNGILSHNCTTGGNGPKFYSSIRCEVRKGEKLEDKDDENDSAKGIFVRIKNTKNKTSVPFRKGQIFLSFETGVDYDSEYFDFAVSYDIIHKGGAWFSIGEDKLGQGKSKALQALKENKALFDDIKKKVLEELTKSKDTTDLLAIEDEDSDNSESEENSILDQASDALDEEY